MDLILRIKTLKWEKTDKYAIAGGYNDEFTADNGDKIIISTCSTFTTKYFINGKKHFVSSEVECYIYDNL